MVSDDLCNQEVLICSFNGTKITLNYLCTLYLNVQQRFNSTYNVSICSGKWRFFVLTDIKADNDWYFVRHLLPHPVLHRVLGSVLHHIKSAIGNSVEDLMATVAENNYDDLVAQAAAFSETTRSTDSIAILNIFFDAALSDYSGLSSQLLSTATKSDEQLRMGKF